MPTAVTADAEDNIYFIALNAVFKLDRDGILTRVAGDSRQGYTGDGGPAARAQLRIDYWFSPAIGLAARQGYLFIADCGNHRVRKVSPDGIISTVAGNGIEGFSGEGGTATDAHLSSPAGLAFDDAGNLFIADWGNRRIRKVSPEGIISTVAGVGKCCGLFEDGVPATQAQLGTPAGLAVDTGGDLVFADSGQNRIRRISPQGIITTVPDTGIEAHGGVLPNPTGVAVDRAGNLFITYSAINVIRKVSPDGTTTTVAGGGDGEGDLGDGGPATYAKLRYPQATAIDRDGNLYITDSRNSRIRKVSPDGMISTVAGGSVPASLGDGGPATSARLALGWGDPAAIGSIAADDSGNLFIADTKNHRIRKVSADGIITTVAGTGTSGFVGNNGPAAEAQLNYPLGVAVDRAGNLFIADTENNYIRKVSTDGIMTTVSGSDSDAGALAAVAVDSAGNVFVANWGMVRRISPDGSVAIVAGGGEIADPVSDGIPATKKKLFYLVGLAVDEAGNLFIADCNGGAHRVSPDGIIHKIALPGSGTPRGVAVDRAGNAFFSKSDSDWDISGGAERIFKVSPDGTVAAIAGTGRVGYSGDGGPATGAELSGPAGIAVDSAGNIYFEDIVNGAVRVLRPAPVQ
jgi:sugar lactone lactonase YvrE